MDDPRSTQPLRNQPRDCFFVLSQGRSGTAFLAHLLDRDARSCVQHEPWPGDAHVLGLSRSPGYSKAFDDLLRTRFEALFERHPPGKAYGEVNSYLRHSSRWLRHSLDARLLHVARDGRDFVRSAWVRNVQTPRHEQLPVVPDDDDPYSNIWAEMDRFERICWIWRHTNEDLLSSGAPLARLEDIVDSYAAFRNTVLDPLQLDVPESAWQAEADKPRNTSSEFTLRKAFRRLIKPASEVPELIDPLPAWKDWSDARSTAFWEICGDVMTRLGYERDGTRS